MSYTNSPYCTPSRLNTRVLPSATVITLERIIDSILVASMRDGTVPDMSAVVTNVLSGEELEFAPVKRGHQWSRTTVRGLADPCLTTQPGDLTIK